MGRAIFLDRDGVLCEDRVDYVKSWDEFIFIPTAAEAIRKINAAGLPIFVVTNQSGVSRGVFTHETVEQIHTTMQNSLRAQGAHVDAFYFCPHTDADQCGCRKPKAGMLRQAAKEHGIDLSRSFMVGDALRDIQAATSAGVTPILVKTGRGSSQMTQIEDPSQQPARISEDVLEAVDYILSSI